MFDEPPVPARCGARDAAGDRALPSRLASAVVTRAPLRSLRQRRNLPKSWVSRRDIA